MREISIIYLFLRGIVCLFQVAYVVLKFVLLLPLTVLKYVRHFQNKETHNPEQRSKESHHEKDFNQLKKESISKCKTSQQSQQFVKQPKNIQISKVV